MKLHVKRINPRSRIPTGSYQSAGTDLYSAEDLVIAPGETAKIATGIAAEIVESPLEKAVWKLLGWLGLNSRWAILLWDRSSMGSKGLHRFSGCIDQDYRGEWLVVLHNAGDEPYEVKAGDKIVQFLLTRVYQTDRVEVNRLSDTMRGSQGFGSTGR